MRQRSAGTRTVQVRPGRMTAAGPRLFVGALALASLAACGPANLQTWLRETASDTYVAGCAGRADQDRTARAELRYNAPILLADKWPEALPGGDEAVLTEADLIAGLAAGKAHLVLVTARGGVGKSTLAAAITAQTCGMTPTLLVDLRLEVAANLDRVQPGSNPILAAIVAQLGIAADADAKSVLAEQLAAQRFVLLLDSLDEVPFALRPAVVEHIRGFKGKFGKHGVIVVLARPAIYSADYGLTDIDARLEMPPLTCSRARATLSWTSTDDASREQATAFLRTYHLDRQSMVRAQCYYPYLAAYRDIQVIQTMMTKLDPPSDAGGLQSNLSTVHEAIVAERLRKELDVLEWTQRQVLTAIDQMVDVGARKNDEWNLEFSIERCLLSVAPRTDSEVQQRQICEKILQSALFERIAGSRLWRFSHRTVSDLFLARWLDRELAGRKGDCAVVTERAELLESKDVAGYLLGQPQGRACLREVVHGLCKAAKGESKPNDVELIYVGMPLGAERAARVQAAQAAEKAAGEQADACVTATLAAL